MSETETAEQPPAPVVNGTPTEIGDGVYVVPDGRVPLVPNVGIVLGRERALVVDTAMGPANGARIKAFADELAGERELLLTITHFHPEHGFGAQAFGGATIVYNRAQLEELHEKGAGYLEMFRTFGESVARELEGVELVEPDDVYDGAVHELDLGGRRVELRTWGLAHTRGDQGVFLPEERILFTGAYGGARAEDRRAGPRRGGRRRDRRDGTRVHHAAARRDAAPPGRGRDRRGGRRGARRLDAGAPSRLGAAGVDRLRRPALLRGAGALTSGRAIDF